MESPEQAVIGNSQMLATLGKKGELRHLFWPTIDYPQHVLGSLPGIFYSNNKASKFEWLTDYPWENTLKYIENTNILTCSFKNPEAELAVNSTDFILPDTDVLIRHFLIQNTSRDDVFFRFFYYNDLALSETDIDDVAYYLKKDDAIVHYKRNYYFLYSGTALSSGHQCGVHNEPSDAFNDVYDSQLSGESLVLYDGSRAVNSCLSWDMGNVRSHETKNLTVFITMGSNENEVVKILKNNRKIRFATQFKNTQKFWTNWINKFKHDFKDETLNRMVKRSLLTLKLLIDKNHGGIVAAPCMDPEYRFCWPRDATYVAYAFDKCGFYEEPETFYKWCKRAQEKEGGLYQRYYIEARIKGPCWSSQIDEIATVIWGIGKHFDLTEDYTFLKSMWPTIKKAAIFLCNNFTSKTNLIKSVGLWEEKFGSHTYSNATVYSALKTSSKIAETLGENSLCEKWDAIAEKTKTALLKLAWNPQKKRFIKTFDPRNDDLDVSLLGLSYPFEVLPAQDELMKSTALAIEKTFNYKSGGIGRYFGDVYYNGNPWILASLWLSLYYTKLGEINKVEQFIKWTIDHATYLDLLSEQIDKSNGSPISAVPLAWSHAFFILAVLGLNEIR